VNQTSDLSTIAIAVAVLALFVGFFVYVALRFWSVGRRMKGLLDGRAERQRQQLAREEGQDQPPAWQQAVRRMIQIALVLAALALAWLRLRGV
jgi:hypothetical protein